MTMSLRATPQRYRYPPRRVADAHVWVDGFGRAIPYSDLSERYLFNVLRFTAYNRHLNPVPFRAALDEVNRRVAPEEVPF